jgi:hypothetical protein
MRRHQLIFLAAVAAAVFTCTCLASAAPKSNQRTREKPCREGLLGIVSMLDAKTDNSDDYRRTFSAIVETCGPVAPAPKSKEPPPNRAGCRDLAMAMVDLIEDGKMNTKAFVEARDRFAQACPPRYPGKYQSLSASRIAIQTGKAGSK